MKNLHFTTLLIILLVSASSSVFAANATSLLLLEDANLRSGPGTEFPIITTLYADTEVSSLKREDQWVQIDVPDIEKQGWIHSSLVKENLFSSVAGRIQPVIGIIDIQRVLNESKPGIAAKEKFDQLREINEQKSFEKIEEQIVAGIIVEIQTIVTSYAAQNGYTHILNKNSGAVFYYDDVFDITSDIINTYNQQVRQSNRHP